MQVVILDNGGNKKAKQSFMKTTGKFGSHYLYVEYSGQCPTHQSTAYHNALDVQDVCSPSPCFFSNF